MDLFIYWDSEEQLREALWKWMGHKWTMYIGWNLNRSGPQNLPHHNSSYGPHQVREGDWAQDLSKITTWAGLTLN